MDIKLLTPEKLSQIKVLLQSLNTEQSAHSIIQDNKALFSYEEKNYRVRLPNQREQTLAEQIKGKLQIKLVQEEGNIDRKQLIKVLKEKQDIDILELEKTQEKIREELHNVFLELAVIDSIEVKKIEELTNKKQDIEMKFLEITIEISGHLEPCIQEITKAEYIRYLSYLCAEKQVDKDTYEPVWKDYEEYGKDDTGLTYNVIASLNTLLLNIKE